jgi:hypothetical protein
MVNSYFYPYMIYHVSHERNVFPELGLPSGEKVVAHALPKIEVALEVTEQQLAHGKDYLLGAELALADLYLPSCTYSFSFAPEAKAMYRRFPTFNAWRERMEALPAVKKLRASLPPRAPIGHARMGHLTSAEILRKWRTACDKLALIFLTVSLMPFPASAQSNIKPKCPAGYDLVGNVLPEQLHRRRCATELSKGGLPRTWRPRALSGWTYRAEDCLPVANERSGAVSKDRVHFQMSGAPRFDLSGGGT